MPTVRKLTSDEVETIENKGKGLRKLTEEQYDRFLSDYEAGEYGEAELEPDEKRLTVRNRLKAAATRRGLKLHFNRTTGNFIRFRVVSANSPMDGQSAAPERAAEPAATPKRKGGRPKKVSA